MERSYSRPDRGAEHGGRYSRTNPCGGIRRSPEYDGPGQWPKGRAEIAEDFEREVVGRVDNSAYPQITVNIQVSVTTPANAKHPVPIMIEFGRLGGVRDWRRQAIAKVWAYGSLYPASVQPDNNHLTTEGIIGLTSKGQPRKPEDWGSLRAWQWGASRVIDYTGVAPARRHPLLAGVL